MEKWHNKASAALLQEKKPMKHALYSRENYFAQQ